jgi:hypothetical protein
MEALRPLFALLPAAFIDWRAIVAKRWPFIAMGAVAAVAISAWSIYARQPVALLAVAPVQIGMALLIYADAMRVRSSEYALSLARIGELVPLALGQALIFLCFVAPGYIVLRTVHAEAPGEVLIAVGTIIASAKLLFVYFAAESSEGPFVFSWSATAGRGLAPALAVSIIGFALYECSRLVFELPGDTGPLFLRGAEAMTSFVLLALSRALIFPWTVRWMAIADELRTNVPAAR